jgi:hypothetical protein
MKNCNNFPKRGHASLIFGKIVRVTSIVRYAPVTLRSGLMIAIKIFFFEKDKDKVLMSYLLALFPSPIKIFNFF